MRHTFENITSILFVVNLASYDCIRLKAENKDALTGQLYLFNRIVNSGWPKYISIMLLLTNVCAFKDKLSRKPLARYFPEYSGGADFEPAIEYLSNQFKLLNRSNRDIYQRTAEADDPSIFQWLASAVQDTIVQVNCSSIIL